MEKRQVVCLALFLLFSVAESERIFGNDEADQRSRYTSSWAVEITEGGEKMAEGIARRHGFINAGKVANFDNIYHFKLSSEERARAPTDFRYDIKSRALLSEPCVGFADQQVILPRVKMSYRVPQDPLFQRQWYLLNSGQYGNESRGNDLNVERAWLQGLTGCNVTVAIIDDGIDYLHNDLWDNFAPSASYDFVDGDHDPIAVFDDYEDRYDTHGTSCAGIVSAAKDNDKCGVGIAYNSNLAGIRLLFANTDMNEAQSLSYSNDITDIYSNSWGPCNYGCVGGPEKLTQMTLKNGAETGRGGKGSIFVWANGNGGDRDDCGANSFATNIYTISVGAVSVTGKQTWFDEKCSAKMVVNYVTDAADNSAVSTTATGGGCRTSFGGTSSATPMAAGIIALTLEANPNLSWRDVQYLLVYTSNPSLTSGGNYTVNGAGILVSHQFGFGVMDAEAMVTRARHWISVPPQLEHIRNLPTNTEYATSSQPLTTTLQYSGSIAYLEHIVINMTLVSHKDSSRRGDIRIRLTSPSGTQSILLNYRYSDMSRYRSYSYSSKIYERWPFMSVMFWGEDPRGQWTLTIESYDLRTEIEMRNVTFQFYGTSEVPQAVHNIPDQCHSDCARGCAAEGSMFCDACANLRNAYTLECIENCPPGYTERNGYCYNLDEPLPVCDSKPSKGSCVAARFSGCCKDCIGIIENITSSCFCDEACYKFNDCCEDIAEINCTQGNATSVSVMPMPYITLGETDGVDTRSVPRYDDTVSAAVRVPMGFPFGNFTHTAVYVCTNGYFVFDYILTTYTPYLFTGFDTYSLVAPFFTDIDISNGVGQIRYEIHITATSEYLLSNVSKLISEHMGSEFSGEWLLIAEWRDVPAFGQSSDITNTFQGIVATDHLRSFAVFTYKCGDIGHSNRATIGFTAGDVLFANHPLTVRKKAQDIACLNSPESQWVNVVYELTREDLQPPDIPINECEDDNGGCDQICEDTPLAFNCQCRNGYVLNPNGKSCDDINECTTGDNRCEQRCINTIGSYTCACNEGYALNDDGLTCHISCGGVYNSSRGSFHTPGWPRFYPLDFRCEWIIQPPVGGTEMVLEVTVNGTAYGIHGRPPCETDYLEFYDGLTTDAQSLGRYCRFDKPGVLYTSSNQAVVVFQASTTPHLPSRVGVQVLYQLYEKVNECEENNGGCEGICVDTFKSFECHCDVGYTLHSDGHSCEDIDECAENHNCEDTCMNTEGSFHCACSDGFVVATDGRSCVPSCGGRLTQAAGSLSTPGWPHYYPSIDFRCVWMVDIENHTDALIDIIFSQPYGVQGRDPCRTDYVQVLDGVGEEAPSLGKFCFLTVPQPITTSSHQATVIFQASSLPHPPSRVGVGITYSTIQNVNECNANNGGCEQICVNTPRSYTCACREGYTLDEDGMGCTDINECASASHGCGHQCMNVEGSYTCACRDGYALGSDNRTCSVSCGGRLTGTSGSFQTPDWPEHYPQLNFRCVWTIENLTTLQSVRFEIDDSAYGINGRPPCSKDYIEFFNGTESTASSLGKFCRLDVPKPITVTAGGARVVFHGKKNRFRPASRVGVKVYYAVLG